MAFAEFLTEMILPFLLVFVVIFAILQRSKILENAQVDAMVSLVVGLLLIGLPGPRDIIINIMPWLAVGVAVMLVFFILYGFAAGDISGSSKWMKITFGILAGLFTIGIVLYVTGLWETIVGWFSGDVFSEGLWMSIVVVILVVVAMVFAVNGSKGSEGTTPAVG
ncbi:MAG: hypothetical protein NUV97_03825 [archaeon]|nr:hypothetical protein [archaeon]MCR4323853.1 hypothetical protein [Nanoarchaeota archaeon]